MVIYVPQIRFCKAGAELGQAQLKLELELSFTWFKVNKLINKNIAV